METQQAEPYAGVAVPVNDPAPVAPVPYTGAEPVAPAQVVAQESLPYAGSGSVMRIQLADGRILEVDVPPGTPPGHKIHFPVAAAPPPQLAAPAPQPPMARAGAPAVPPTPPETLTIQVPPGAIPGSVFRIKLTDGRDLDVTVPHGFPPGAPLTIPVPPRPVDREGRPLAGIKKKTHPLACMCGPMFGPSLGGPGGCDIVCCCCCCG